MSHEIHMIDSLHSIRVVDPQVVLHHCYVLKLALVLQANQKVAEPICIVGVIEDLVVNKASLKTYGTN
jgi:hypothetical protein